jgi:RNA polymerase sigma factor (sigma-70 family)
MSISTDIPLLSKLCCARGIIAKWCLQKGVLESDFDDIFHDVLIKLVDALPNYDRKCGTRFRSWLKTVVTNALIDRIRLLDNHPFPKLIRDHDIENETLVELVDRGLDSLAEQLTEQSTSAAEILAKVERRVKPETWNSFVRRELLADEVEAIAQEMGIKKASIYQSCSRVRSLIKVESERYFSG